MKGKDTFFLLCFAFFLYKNTFKKLQISENLFQNPTLTGDVELKVLAFKRDVIAYGYKTISVDTVQWALRSELL